MFVVLIGEPKPGDVVEYGREEYTVTAVEPHRRKDDGRPTTLITWRVDCRGCGAEHEFSTGTRGVRFQPFCRPCLKDGGSNAERDNARAAERQVETIPDVVTIYRAVQKAHPAQMSMADNAPRRIYAPAVLREADPDNLGHRTLAEIKAGLLETERLGLIAMATIGRRPCGHALRGYWPRPASAPFVRRHLHPDETGVFA